VGDVLARLAPGTTYHYWLVATNRFGTAYGADHAFVTAGRPLPPAEGVRLAATAELSGRALRIGSAEDPPTCEQRKP